MDIRLFQGQPVLLLERFEGGSVKCCAIFSGRGLPFEFIAEENALVPEENNNSAPAGEARLTRP
jgi:hypothetical protein